MIVIDASVLANAVGDDEAAGRQARALLRSHRELAAPDVADVETTAVLRRRWLAGVLTEERFEQALDWPLWTGDRRLAHASGPRCTIELITPAD